MKVHLCARKPTLFFRVLTWFVIISFASQDLSLLAAAPIRLSPEVHTDTAAFIKSFNIPESWGRIEDRYLPDGAQISAQPLIYIQDAHAQPDAQRKIQLFLEYLAAEKLADGVFVEGASGKLSPAILELFQDSTLNLSMAEYLLDLGELSGAEYYMMKNGGAGMPVHGIESPQLYKASFGRFHEIKAGKDGVRDVMKQYRQLLEKLQILNLSADLQEYAIRKMSWKSSHDDLSQYINVIRPFASKHLGLDFNDPRLQFDWPGLVRFSTLEKMDRKTRPEKAAGEAEKIAAALETEASNPVNKAAAAKLREVFSQGSFLAVSYLKDQALPGVASYREFFELLRKAAKAAGMDLFIYPDILRAAESLILREELESKILFDEIESLEKALEEKLVSNPKEAEILALTSDFLTAEKMLGLSLTRKEYDLFTGRKDLISPDGLRTRLAEAAGNNQLEADVLGRIPAKIWQMSEEFYVLSLKRDHELLDNTLSLIGKDSGKNGVKAKVLIAGGFHSDGLRRLLKEKKIPHIIVTPRISKLSEKELYEKVMMGEHSRLDFLAEGTALAKVVFFQIAKTYAELRPDADSGEQARLVFKAVHDRAVPLLRERGLSNREIFNLLSGEIAQSKLFQGTRLSLRYDAGRDQIVFGEFDQTGDGSASQVQGPRAVSAVRVDGPQTAPREPFFARAFKTAVEGPAAFPGLLRGLTPTVRAVEDASRSELRIPLATNGLTREQELELLVNSVLPELHKAQRGEHAELPVAQTFSDIHGGIERLDPILVDRMLAVVDRLDEAERARIAEAVLKVLRADPLASMLDAIASHGIDIDREIRPRMQFQNLGDLVDRGPDGLKVIRRSIELVNAGLSSFVIGNHDLYMLMSLLGFHLPWYDEFEFYGYEDQYGSLKTLIEEKHRDSPETKDKNWWTRQLDEYMKYQKAQQKTKWAAIEKKVSDKGGLYGRAAAVELDDDQQKAWDMLRGWYLVKISTGVSAAGLMSNKWWEELLAGKKDAANAKENFKGFRELYAELETSEGFDADSDTAKAWREAIALMEDDILKPLQEEFKTKVEGEGKWAWRVFDAINYKNYVSPEWYALDWVTHGDSKKGWGPRVLAEGNEINKLNGRQVPEITLANYLEDSPANEELIRAREFLLGRFNLHLRTIYQGASIHGFIPLQKDGPYAGRFYYEHKGQMYMGNGDTGHPSIWEGFDQIAREVVSATSMREYHAAFTTVTSWYADRTTESKPHDIAYALNTFGPHKIAELNVGGWLTTGHVPIKSFAEIPMQERKWVNGFLAGELFAFSDRSWAAPYGRWGGVIESDPNKGFLLRGYESAASDEIVDNPNTYLVQPGPDEQATKVLLFENPGLSQKRFADMAVHAVENRIRFLKGEQPLPGPVERSELRVAAFDGNPLSNLRLDDIGQMSGVVSYLRSAGLTAAVDEEVQSIRVSTPTGPAEIRLDAAFEIYNGDRYIGSFAFPDEFFKGAIMNAALGFRSGIEREVSFFLRTLGLSAAAEDLEITVFEPADKKIRIGLSFRDNFRENFLTLRSAAGRDTSIWGMGLTLNIVADPATQVEFTTHPPYSGHWRVTAKDGQVWSLFLNHPGLGHSNLENNDLTVSRNNTSATIPAWDAAHSSLYRELLNRVLSAESGTAGAGQAEGGVRSELRTATNAEEFLDQSPAYFSDLWNANQVKNKPTLVAVSGSEASGKTMLTHQIAVKTAEAVERKGGHVRVLSLDRFFLDRHRRNPGNTARDNFFNKWEIEADSDRSKATASGPTVKFVLEALKNGRTAYIPFFLNHIKQRLRISPSGQYTDAATGNMKSGQDQRLLNGDIQRDLALLEAHAISPVVEDGGRRFLKLFDAGFPGLDPPLQWNFKPASNDQRMTLLLEHVRAGAASLGEEENNQFTISDLYVDLETGDIVERFNPSKDLIFVEGVISLLDEAVPNVDRFYDSTVWFGIGNQEVPPDEEQARLIRKIEHWRYLMRRTEEGRLQSAGEALASFNERRLNESPLIARGKTHAMYVVDTTRPQESEWIEKLENTKPVILAFDVGGGRIGFAHQPFELTEDGITFRLEGDLQQEIFEKTRSREGPNNLGKDTVLGEIALMALERLRTLKASYPGKQIQPIIAIGAPGNRGHPSTNGTIAPHSADNLGVDFSGINPVEELEEIFFQWAGIRPVIVWNNDSLAQAYAAVRELLPFHAEYKKDTVLFLSLGTGLGMGVVKVDGEGKFSTIGDSHNFDLDFTDRFDLTTHPEYGNEVFTVNIPQEYYDEGIQEMITRNHEVYVPTSVPEKVRSEDVASGRGLSQIFSAFERDAMLRAASAGSEEALPLLQRPFFIRAASVLFSHMSDEEKSDYMKEFAITNPVYKKLIERGYESLNAEEREQLPELLAHDSGTIATVWLLNELAAKHNQSGYPDLAPYSAQVEFWVTWAAEFLAAQVLEVIVRTRGGRMDKVNGSTTWPEEWREQLRQLNIHHVVVGSTVATKGDLGTLFRSTLKRSLKELEKKAVPGSIPAAFTLNEVSSDTKRAAIRGARDFPSPSDVQQKVMLGIKGSEPVAVPPSLQYSAMTVDRGAQLERAFKQVRGAVFLDLGDVVVSKYLTEGIIRKITEARTPRNLTLEAMSEMTAEQKRREFKVPPESVDAYVSFEQIKRILARLIEKGVPVGVATGKPLSEVTDLFGKELAGRIYIYALNGNMLHPPGSMQRFRPGGGLYFEASDKAAINALIKDLGRYGFGPARVYTDKSDLGTYTSQLRTYEPAQSPGSQINVTSILGDNPRNPNNQHRGSGTEYRLITAEILNHLLRQRGITAKAAYAGRIGIDIVYHDKGDAMRDFQLRIEEALQPSTVAALHDDDRKRDLGPAPKHRAVNLRHILRIGDSYAKGLGQDAPLIGRDPSDENDTAFSVGRTDEPDAFDMLGPVTLGGGPQKTAETLSKIRFTDSQGRIFHVDIEGNAVNEEAPAVGIRSLNLISSTDARRIGEYEKSIDLLRSRHLVVAPDGSQSKGATGETATGWVFAPVEARLRVARVKKFMSEVAPHYRRAVIIGMGGPGNAAGMPIRIFDAQKGVLLDHPSPQALKAVEGDLKKTLFVVLSKSGTTPEIVAMMHFFMRKVRAAGLNPNDHFTVVTDKQSPLASMFPADRTFINDTDRDSIGDVGGRFSLPTYFGLFPAALAGVDIDYLVQGMARAAHDYQTTESTARLLGVQIADAIIQAKALGRDKVTLVIPPLLSPYADFVEQLFNESLGKGADPIVLIANEPFSKNPAVYGRDRVFLRIDFDYQNSFSVTEQNGAPFIDIRTVYEAGLGYLAYHSMMAAALIGLQTKINPFDQPGVEASKRMTKQYLDSAVAGKSVEEVEREISGGRIVQGEGVYDTPIFLSKALTEAGGILADEEAGVYPNNAIQTALDTVGEKEYVSVLLATHKGQDVSELLAGLRTKIRDRHPHHPATMAGIIPIDNHSNLQLYSAAGNDNGVVIILTFDTPTQDDVKIPREALIQLGYPETVAESLTFGDLTRLIAAGEFEALNKDGKRVLRIHLPATYRTNLAWIDETFDDALSSIEGASGAEGRSELRSTDGRRTDDARRIMERWELVKKKTFHAEIADVDGNLTPLQDVKAKEVPPDVIEIMKGRVLRGVPMALASVRSEDAVRGLKEIEDQVLKGVPEDKQHLFFLFPENGTFASWSEISPLSNKLVRRRVDLAKYFKLVPRDYVMLEEERQRLFQIVRTQVGGEEAGLLSYHESKTYGFQIKVDREPGMIDQDYEQRVTRFTEATRNFLTSSEDPDLNRFDVVKTRTSLLILPRGVNKSLSIRYFADRFGIKHGEIIGTDDQGEREGNGWYLTSHSGGFSTYGYNPRSNRQLPLTVITKEETGTALAGVDAWRYLNDHIKMEAPEPLSARSGRPRLAEQLFLLEMEYTKTLQGITASEMLKQVANGMIILKGEDVDIIYVTAEGEEAVAGAVDRNVAEAFGLLHRTSNAFIKTPEGKFLIQRRAHNKSQPLKLSIFGGHAAPGQNYFETIQKEIKEELGLPPGWVLEGTFKLVGQEGGFNSPAADLKNRERRSLYIYNATERELEVVRELKARLETKLAELGDEGYRDWLEDEAQTGAGTGEIWALQELTLPEMTALPEENLTSDLLAPLLKGKDADLILAALEGRGNSGRSELRLAGEATGDTADPNMSSEEVRAARTLLGHLSGSAELPTEVNADHVLAVLGNPYGFYPALAARAAEKLNSKAVLVVGKGAFPVPEAERISEAMKKAAPGLAEKIIYNPEDVSMHTGMNVEEVVKLFKQRGLTTANLVLMQIPTGMLLSRRIFEKQWIAAAAKHGLDQAPPAIHMFAAEAPYTITEAGTADLSTLFSLEHALGQIQRLRDWPGRAQPPIDRRAEDLPEAVVQAADLIRAFLDRRGRIDNEAKAPGLTIDGKRVYTPITTELSIDDIFKLSGLTTARVESVTITGGPNNIPVYAADKEAGRWGSTADLTRRLLEIETVKPSEARSEIRAARPGVLDEMKALYAQSADVLGDYETRRWVAVHIAGGIFAVLPPGLSAEQKEAVTGFLKRDLFYMDYAGNFSIAGDGAFSSPSSSGRESQAALDISVIAGIKDPPAHFLGVAHALQNHPQGRIFEFVLDGNPEEIARLNQIFQDEYGYSKLAGRYRLEAVSRKDLYRRAREAVKKTFNEVRAASGFANIAEFQEHVTFSSPEESILLEGLAQAGWLIVNDLVGHPGVQSFFKERSLKLSAGRLEAELIKKLQKILKEKNVIFASRDVLADVDPVYLVNMWDSYNRDRLIGRSA